MRGAAPIALWRPTRGGAQRALGVTARGALLHMKWTGEHKGAAPRRTSGGVGGGGGGGGAIDSRSQQQIIVEDGARVNGPLIAERSMAIGAAAIGMASRRTTISAPRIRLHSGATIYGAVVASQAGLTVI